MSIIGARLTCIARVAPAAILIVASVDSMAWNAEFSRSPDRGVAGT